MLFSLDPFTDIFASIWPEKCTKTVLLIAFVLSLVFLPTWKNECALSIHQVVFPFSFKNSPILPSVFSVALDFGFEELPFICTFISPYHFSMSVLLVTLPLANVYIAVKIDESAKAMVHALTPIAVVSGSVWPNLYTSPIFKIIKPFSFIQGVKFIIFENGSHKSLFAIRRLLSPIKFRQFFYFLHNDQIVIIWFIYFFLCKLRIWPIRIYTAWHKHITRFLNTGVFLSLSIIWVFVYIGAATVQALKSYWSHLLVFILIVVSIKI